MSRALAADKQAALLYTPTLASPAASATETRREVSTQKVSAVSADTPPPDEVEMVESPGDVVSEGADSANVWPDERAEAAFISETRGRGEPVPVATPEIVEEVTAKPLPSLDEMVKRIPEETRELLDELFRAKFTTVRRVRKNDLKISV